MTQRKAPAALVAAVAVVLVLGTVAVVKCQGRTAKAAVFGWKESRVVRADEVLDPPPTDPLVDLRISVGVSVTYDSTTKLYTYAYAVTNQHQSNNYLETFGIAPVSTPVSMSAPAHWYKAYGWEENLHAAVWEVLNDDTTSTPGLNIPLSPWNPAPNSTTGGFSIVSRQPPNTVTWYAQGFDTLRHGEDDEELPGSETLFTTSVNGTTQGPDITSVVSVGEKEPKAGGPGLESPKPNPSRGTASITFYLAQSAAVSLGIFDVGGRRLRSLVEEKREAGLHEVPWDGLDDSGKRVQPGVYFYQLLLDGRAVGRRKVTLLK
jgi:hypothetical protein